MLLPAHPCTPALCLANAPEFQNGNWEMDVTSSNSPLLEVVSFL